MALAVAWAIRERQRQAMRRRFGMLASVIFCALRRAMPSRHICPAPLSAAAAALTLQNGIKNGNAGIALRQNIAALLVLLAAWRQKSKSALKTAWASKAAGTCAIFARWRSGGIGRQQKRSASAAKRKHQYRG